MHTSSRLLIGLLIIFCSTPLSFFAQQHPNILLIIGDDMGVDAIDGFGIATNPPSTPHLDSLRAMGVSFTQVWASPACAPTRAAIMSGKYGIKNGVTTVPGNLDTTHTSLFRELNLRSSQPYATALIGKWHISQPSNNFSDPQSHGIDEYMGTFTSGVTDYYAWDKLENGLESIENTYASAYFTNYANTWIAQQNQPWICWLAHVSPHSPIHEPPAGTYTQSPVNSNYQKFRAMIENLDYEIGRVFDAMSQQQKENTLVIFVGDNGTSGNLLREFPSGKGKGTVYEGGVRVPMIVSGAGVSRQGVTEDAMIHVSDIYATILEMADSTIADVGGLYNSLSFAHLLHGNPQNRPTRTYNYSEFTANNQSSNGDVYAIRNDQYKLIVNTTFQTEELYDLMNDPFEGTDLLTGSLTSSQQVAYSDLLAEATVIRTDWSCDDHIQNGGEDGIDCIGTPCADCSRLSVAIQPTGEEQVQIYPNPTASALSLFMPESGNIRVWDHQGKMVQLVNSLRAGERTLNTDSWPEGIYFLEVEIKGKKIVEKVMIQH
ncbi:MAG: sulfatase-like hydrolase/transferase [Bacteroidota bacterium]